MGLNDRTQHSLEVILNPIDSSHTITLSKTTDWVPSRQGMIRERRQWEKLSRFWAFLWSIKTSNIVGNSDYWFNLHRSWRTNPRVVSHCEGHPLAEIIIAQPHENRNHTNQMKNDQLITNELLFHEKTIKCFAYEVELEEGEVMKRVRDTTSRED